jgi:branched-chain amino acid transport system ATP-binding protein
MLMEMKSVSAGYYRKRVIHDISLSVDRSEVVSLIGHNGAGKTTTLKTILGVIRSEQGEIRFRDKRITGQDPVENVAAGIRFIPQERFTFPDLTVWENIMLGAHHVQQKEKIVKSIDEIYTQFPILKKRLSQKAGTMSGGEQRMLSMAMAMMAQPEFVMVDEPSLGLAPLIIQEIGRIIRRMADQGMAVLLVDQNIKHTLKISNRVYVMKNGQIVLEETSQKLLDRGEWWDLY